MSATVLRVVVAGLSFLLIFLSGFWLSRSGKPYDVAILTIHKLISLVAAVIFAITVYNMNRVAGLSGVELAAVSLTGLIFLGTVVSGGLLSIDRPMPAAILTAHRITPYLTALSTAVTLYLLLRRN